MLDASLLTISNHLHASRNFETASEHLLQAMFGTVASSIPSLNRGVEVLRGTIHFRPENEYRRLFSLELRASVSDTQPLRLPSLTAWRWVSGRGCPVGIDVEAQLLNVFEGGTPRLFHDPSAPIALSVGETCQRLTARDADYVLAYPLRRHSGIVDGMVSLEFRGTKGFGEQLHLNCGAVLQLLVDLAAPHLAWLPGAAAAHDSCSNEYLPVVGATTAPLVALLRVFSRLEETLLITGPTGVGKSRLARFCHALSARRDKPFVTLDLLSCPEELQMPQLCGSRKGAYTGAERDMPGAIQRAEGGTLFIDEIDKLSLPAQAGLLRLLEDRVYRPIGDGGDDRKANVRFIVGTIANLRDAVAQGRFREDLYYRIAVLVVRVPPLAQRTDEILAWANYMLARCAHAAQRGANQGSIQLDDGARAALEKHGWPGNLRQLDNVVRRAYAYSLLDSAAGGDSVYVSSAHVKRAMTDELDEAVEGSQDSSVAKLMLRAARAYALEALRRAQTEQPLPLCLADAFRAMVLDAAVDASDSDKDVALEALGLGNVVRDRNHHRVIKREAELLGRFYSALTPNETAQCLSSSDH